MNMARGMLSTTLALFLAAGLALSTGCTKYASPDDMKTLDAAQKAAVSAEKELEQAKAERRKVEQELADVQKELQAAQGELKRVENP